MKKFRAANALAAVLAISLLATACSGSDDDAAPVNTVAPVAELDETTTSTSTTTTTTTTVAPTTTSTTTTTTVAELSDEAQIEQLVDAYWSTFFDAWNPPDPSAEVWLDVATPGLADLLAENVQEGLDAGTGIRAAEPDGPFLLSSQIVIQEVLAFIEACVRDAGAAYDLETGEATREADVVSVKRMEAQLTPDGWRITSSEGVEDFERGQEDECAASLSSSP